MTLVHLHEAKKEKETVLTILRRRNENKTAGCETHTHFYDVTDGSENEVGTSGNFSFSTGDPRETNAASSLPAITKWCG